MLDAAAVAQVFQPRIQLRDAAAPDFLRGVLAIPERELAQEPGLVGKPAPADVHARDPARFCPALAELALHRGEFGEDGAKHYYVVILDRSVVLPTVDEQDARRIPRRY